ncbi:MAG: S8 family serine peptidase [Patescibacteria group bacterium]|jgi:serine protease
MKTNQLKSITLRCLAVGILIGCFSWLSQPAYAIAPPPSDEVIVRLKDSVAQSDLPNLRSRFQAAELSMPNIPTTKIIKMKLSSGDNIEDAIQRLYGDSLVAIAQPNYRYQIAFTPNDGLYSFQWNLAQINMPTAWDTDQTEPAYGGDPGVIVAVVDTGVAYENYGVYGQAPDLSGTSFVAGYDFINDDAHANDDQGHGTHMTGTIAQTTNNEHDEAGIAFNSTIMPVKVMDHTGSGTTETVSQGIDFAVAQGAKVINLSLTATTDDPIFKASIDAALASHVVIVAAAGNDGEGNVDYPAAYPGVISVGAVRYDATRSYFSNYGTGLQIMAPGGDTRYDQNSDGFIDGILQESFTNTAVNYTQFSNSWAQGTSSATAHVSGAAALLIAAGADPATVKTVLTETALDLGTTGYDTETGFGLLDVAAALYRVVTDTTAPISSVSLSPTATTNGYYTTTPAVTLSAQDNRTLPITISYHWDAEPDTTYAGPMAAPEGVHTLYYHATDQAGNAEIAQSLIIQVDITGPDLIDFSPASETIVTDRKYTITGRATDTISPVTGITANNHALLSDADGRFSYTLRLHSGKNIINLATVNQAGLATTQSLTLYYRPQNTLLVGAGPGGGPQVRFFSSSGKNLKNFLAYDASFRGGIKVASGDVDGDLQEEIVTAPGPGMTPMIRVFDLNGKLKKEFLTYGATFRGGVNLAVDDLDGDNVDEIVVVPESGGGPNVRIFGYRNGSYQPTTQNFMAYATTFRGGVSVTTGDLDGDGKAEIITAPLSAGGPQLRVFGYRNGSFRPVIQGLMAYADSFRGGVTLGTGDINGDGLDEIITGIAGGGGPQVRVFGRKSNGIIGLINPGFMAFAGDFRGGIVITATDLDGDGIQEIVAGVRSGGNALLRYFSGNGKKMLREQLAFPTAFRGGMTLAIN